ncbi:MAG: hypothetical protein GEV04_15195 [Actinophytocola sp.]|nr:hypothetical protein [Actinophytocola sp.]
MRLRHWLLPALAASLLAITGAATPFPDSIPLPDDFQPEGIAVGTGSTFYAGSLNDGDIYRGDLRSGAGAVFIDEPEGQAAGLKVDERHHRLFVAGAGTSTGIVYDTRDGSTVAEYQFAPPGDAFINDVVVTRDAAYFTDTFSPRLFMVPIAGDGTLGAAQTIPVSGPASPVVGFGLNGIDATSDGKTLVVVNSGLAAAFTIDPTTGVSHEIAVPGGPLPDSPDGILLDGRVLWVVSNFAETLVKVRLSPDLASGEVVATLTDADVHGLFRVPTTVAEFGSRLALVNARFDLGFPPPFGPGAPLGTDFDVVLIDKP